MHTANALAEEQAARQHFAANFDTIINATGVGLWDWDLTSGRVIHSGQLEHIAGYNVGEMPEGEQSARDKLIFPADRKRADDTIAACVDGRLDSYETEFRVVCKDGSVKWVQDRGAVAQRDKDGKATRIVGMFYDVNRFKQTEESLAEKVRMLDFAAGLSGLGSVDWMIAENTLHFDDEFLQVLGYPPAENVLPVKQLRRLVHPDDLPQLLAGMKHFLAEQEDTYSRQLRILHRDGHSLWMLVTARIVEWDTAGAPARAVAGCLNVDALVQAERRAQQDLLENQLAQQRMRLTIENTTKDLEAARRTNEAMFDANPYMNMVFDKNMRPIDCNPAVLEYFNYPTKEALLADFSGIIRSAVPPVQPNGQPSVSFEERMAHTLKYGYTEFETTLVLLGQNVPMNIIMKRITYNGEDAIALYQFDMTGLKLTENALLHQDEMLYAVNEVASLLMETDSDAFMKTLLDALHLLAESLAADRAYVWKNTDTPKGLVATQLCEWPSEAEGNYLEYGSREFCYDDIFPHWEQFLQNTPVFNTPVYKMDEAMRNFAGLADVKAVLLIPIVTQGQFWGFLGFDDCQNDERVFTPSEEKVMTSAGMLIAGAVLRNEMTESLVAAKEDALQSSRAKSEFLSRMSHEIRTPMNAIIGMAAIAHKADSMEKMNYCIEKIDIASRQLLELINDVLDMSKIEANKLELSSNEFDIEKLVHNIYNMVNVRAEEKNLELSFDFRRTFDKKIVCDELRLSQVLTNLLSNAIKFTPEGGRISVSLSYNEQGPLTNTLHIEVKDTGIGISEEGQQRLFEAFEQADQSTTRRFGGTGLGLAISKSIVQLMGGDIWIESEEGKGSCFIFEVAFSWGGKLEEYTAKQHNLSGLRVLVVDDSEDVLIYFKNVLSGFGLLCNTAFDGEDALEMVRQAAEEGEPYHLIFVDWSMPRLSGYETLHQMQKLVDEATKLVIMSVADRTEVEKGSRNLRTDTFLPKPVFPSTLYDTIVTLYSGPAVESGVENGHYNYHWENKRLLLVEDIEINSEIIISLLEDTGIQIDCACDGVEAVELFEKQGDVYDIVLMDMQMPRMDGITATQRIRAGTGAKNAASVPIVAMTANAFREDIEHCLAAGMDNHIAKPVDMDTLFSTLAIYLERH